MQNLCKTGNLSVCTCMLTRISLWGGTEGPFDSCSGWGCLVHQTPSEGLFHWVCSLCIALRLQEGEPKQAVCEQKTEDPMLPEARSLQLLTVPAEHSFRKPSSPVTLPTHQAQWCRGTESQRCSRSNRSCAMQMVEKEMVRQVVSRWSGEKERMVSFQWESWPFVLRNKNKIFGSRYQYQWKFTIAQQKKKK